jgi:UDP-glucose 4-epimerase
MRKVLITGSSGHLGAKALDRLRLHCEVHAIVRAKPIYPQINVVFHEVDLSSDWSTSVLPKQMDAVIHLAQPRDYRNFPRGAPAIFGVNTAAVALLLDYAGQAGVKHFVLASTGGLYQSSGLVINDATPLNPPLGPLGYYFRTKLSAEMLAIAYNGLFHVSILRPFFIYGPGQASDKLIPRLIESVRNGIPISLAGVNGLTINPIHVNDAADLLLKLLESNESHTVNAAGPDAVSLRHIAEEAGRLLNIPPVFKRVDGNGELLVAEHARVAAMLGRSMTGLADGFPPLVRAYR